MSIDLPDIDADGGDLAFLLGVLFNQRVRSELAWQAPARLGERLGACDPFQLATTDPAELADVIGQGPALHPWARAMARNVGGTCGLLVRDYEGHARNIWSDNPTGQALLTRLSSFPGIGQHKARVAIALLIRMPEYLSGRADIPADCDRGNIVCKQGLRVRHDDGIVVDVQYACVRRELLGNLVDIALRGQSRPDIDKLSDAAVPSQKLDGSPEELSVLPGGDCRIRQCIEQFLRGLPVGGVVVLASE